MLFKWLCPLLQERMMKSGAHFELVPSSSFIVKLFMMSEKIRGWQQFISANWSPPLVGILWYEGYMTAENYIYVLNSFPSSLASILQTVICSFIITFVQLSMCWIMFQPNALLLCSSWKYNGQVKTIASEHCVPCCQSFFRPLTLFPLPPLPFFPSSSDI